MSIPWCQAAHGCPPAAFCATFCRCRRNTPHEGCGEGAALRRRMDLLQLLWGEGSAIAHLKNQWRPLDRWIKPWDFLRFFVVLYQEIYMMIPILAKKKTEIHEFSKVYRIYRFSYACLTCCSKKHGSIQTPC